jgi:hypothetical protein
MFEQHLKGIKQYAKLPLKEERKLISFAKNGDSSARQKLLLHQTGFFLFRIHTTLYYSIIKRYGEDIFQDCMLFALEKIQSYRLRFKNKDGVFTPVHFSTYLWKGVTGVMMNAIKREKIIYTSEIEDFAIGKEGDEDLGDDLWSD